jgi:hypothetical protein
MLASKIKITVNNLDLNKQQRFALAQTLTAVAQKAQDASIKAIEGNFAVRTSWYKKQNVYGVRVKPATKANLTAVVGTAADWLEKFVREPPGSVVLKLPQGEFLAIPTSNVRRTKRDLIRAMQRPRALRGAVYKLPLKSGRGFVLMQRQGRGSQRRNVALYILVKRARIKEKDVLFGPARRAFEINFSKLYAENLARALATAKTQVVKK